MYYFGTSLTEHGHYQWELTEGGMSSIRDIRDLPFNPEGITKNLQNGKVVYFQGGGYTAIAIAGSCTDQRPGSVSVFFVKELISFNDMRLRISETRTALHIIHQMKFKIDWSLA